MKILGNTPEGDLIVQVSQAEWNGLGDGVRPKDDLKARLYLWPKTEAAKFLADKRFHSITKIIRAFQFNQIDGSLQSLRDLADGDPKLGYVSKAVRAKLKKLLDEELCPQPA